MLRRSTTPRRHIAKLAHRRVVEQLVSAARIDENGYGSSVGDRLWMIDHKSVAAHEFDGERLKRFAPHEGQQALMKIRFRHESYSKWRSLAIKHGIDRRYRFAPRTEERAEVSPRRRFSWRAAISDAAAPLEVKTYGCIQPTIRGTEK